jgi:hypothetical protein
MFQYESITMARFPHTGCPRTGESNLKGIFLNRNGGEKRSEKYLGCNSFLVMNFSNSTIVFERVLSFSY